ncbi:MAG TPA: pyridoxamine 5'-phosphate oxidase family protein [Nocardioidaceae bacterium]|nr:pyridoxamine 5'-phosphate oxidase family protein [Nocardioidaceae bacterium]
MTSTLTPLSPTDRTSLRRVRERAESDRAALHNVLTTGLMCHFGVVVDGSPLVFPTVYGFDPDGPDRDGTLYLHGSVAARSLLAAPDTSICVTVTLIDGLVLARSAFHHSMNYRSAMIVGTPRIVTDADERDRALTIIVNHVVPDRADTLRAHTRKELAATRVLALPLHEASVKARSGDVNDEPEDIRPGAWAGVLPVQMTFGTPQTNADCEPGTPAPNDVLAIADRPRG